METYQDPYIQTAIVNGLIATIIIWGFWTPFILIVVIGLVNNQIKDGICGAASQFGYNYQYQYLWDILMYLTETFNLDWNTTAAALQTPFNDISAQNLIKSDPEVLSSLNKHLSILMIITCIIVIIVSVAIVYWIVYKYNLNGWAIVRFNLVMAIIIMLIESVFFGGVAAQYIPFYPPDILQNLKYKILNYISTSR